MTHDKAREFFSAYHEGTLEPGLTASLERKLRGDASLREEFDAFARTLKSLDALRFETIEVPFYLNDRIAARIDGAHSAKPVPFWATWFAPRAATPRLGYVVGLAAALLVASVGLREMRTNGANEASVLSNGSDPVRWSKTGDGVFATFDGGAVRTLVVLPEGGESQDYRLADRQPFELTLGNANRLSRRFKVSQGEELFATIAVPGIRPAPRRSGTGTVSELASALADVYRVPVVIKGAPIEATVRWSFDSIDPRTAAEQSLKGQGNATMMEGGVLQITQ